MSIFKCKMCGGTIEFNPGETVGECDSCGTKQTLPKLTDEKKANLFDRANHFRRNNDYDKAMAIYEQILNEDNTDAETYWSLVLCRYGIEYVEDPATAKRVPTVNRAQFTSVLADEDYKSAIANADMAQRILYEDEAKAIDEIQKGILEISQKEEPFDVFICYKETDSNGRRTQDSVLATELYHELTNEGFKVFFSRITLEDKLGTAYEPYIFAALNSAKVMVVLGTKSEYFNAVWVKNEWSRYLALIKNGAKKMLIPAYRDMDPYDLPEEFSHLQAQDMSKLGFMQDLIRGIKKILDAEKEKETVKETVRETVVVSGGTGTSNTAPLLERMFMFLEDGEWDKADEFAEQVLNQEPKNAQAYLGKLMAELRVKKQEELKNREKPFDDKQNYQKIKRFGDSALIEKLEKDNQFIRERNEEARLSKLYETAWAAMKEADSEKEYLSAAKDFDEIKAYRDSAALVGQCREKAEECRRNGIYASAVKEMDAVPLTGTKRICYKKAIELFRSIDGWKDSSEQIHACERKIAEIDAKEEADRLEAERKAEERRIAAEKATKKRKKAFAIGTPIVAACIAFVIVLTTVIIPNSKYNAAIKLMDDEKYEEAISAFETMNGYKDSTDKISLCQTALKDIDYNAAIELMDDEKYEEAITAFEALNGYKDSENQIESCYIGKYGEEKWNKIKNLKVGDTYTFGAYEQDNNTSNGKEAIGWTVLDKDGFSFLLISKQALDCQQYNTSYTDVTWENCSLREWMNGTFLNNAFSAEEQAQIQNTTVSADKNPEYSTNPGNATSDKVFLLSIAEAERYFSSVNARKCKPTEYAVANGAYVSSDNGNCLWWLRSPGFRQNTAAAVDKVGSVNYLGGDVNNVLACVRPALWINLGS